MGKKGEIFAKLGVLILVIVFIGLSTITSASAQVECSPADLSFCGGVDITQSGHGAVELCQDCFKCGVADGVCPEDFSDGTIETDENKTRINLRVGNDRPILLLPNANPIIFNTGIIGCETINGTCSDLEYKSTWDGTWTPEGDSTSCTRDMNTFTNYRRAVCSAPKTAGCQYCPDPDCTTDIIGITFDPVTNQSFPSHVNVISLDNPIFRAQGTSDGTFSMQSPRGNVRIVCTAEEYDVFEQDIFLQKGSNVVDCRLSQASCSPLCTLPDISGVPICVSRCDDQNSCNYFSDETKAICDGVPEGAEVIINRTDETFITAVTCCTGGFIQLYRPLPGGLNDHIPNLLTRDYRKELNGIPVNLRIITYTKE